jgi:SHS2 domain-containing protein
MKSGFTELPHTADWAVRVWAADLPGLLSAAANGMNALAGIRLLQEPRVSRIFETESPDAESLLVAFLSELIFAAEQDKLAFDQFRIETAQHTGFYTVHAEMEGAPVAAIEKPIKAVTYHNLEVRSLEDGLVVEIVFDV